MDQQDRPDRLRESEIQGQSIDRPDRYTLEPQRSYDKYLNDVTRLRQTGVVDSDKQKQSPMSAGSRGLHKVHKFIDDTKNKWQQNTLEDIKVILTKIDTINNQ